MAVKHGNKAAVKPHDHTESGTARPAARRVLRNPACALAALLLAALCLGCLCAPLLTPYAYDRMEPAVKFALPSAQHPFGCDYAGRDLLSRVLYGGRITLRIAAQATLLAAVCGVLLGLLAGWRGGWADLLLMRGTEVLSAVPSILLVILAEFLLGWGKGNFVYAMALAALPSVVRVTRAAVLGVAGKEYIEASRALGVPPLGIVRRHVLHNIAAPLLIHLTGMLAEAVLTCTLMGYIGIGINPPQPEWGVLVYEGYKSMRSYPHTALFPAGTVILCVLCINLIGSGLRDALGGEDGHE